MDRAHRQEVRPSWEGAGSQSQGLASIQPVKGSLRVSSLHTSGLSEGGVFPSQMPLPFTHNLFHWAMAGGNLPQRTARTWWFIVVISAKRRQRWDIESSRPCPSNQTNQALGLLVTVRRGWQGPMGDSLHGTWLSTSSRKSPLLQERSGPTPRFPSIVTSSHKARPQTSSSLLVCC